MGPMKQRNSIRSVAIEVFSIVFGVLLALGVNEWRSVRSAEARAAAAVANIRQEIEANRTMLTTIHDNNVRTVRAMAEDDADNDSTAAFIPGLQLKDAAWEAARTSGALERLDYEVLLSLSGLYKIQDVYVSLGRQLSEAVLMGNAFAAVEGSDATPDDIVRRLTWVLDLLVEAEGGLLERYGKALEETDSATFGVRADW